MHANINRDPKKKPQPYDVDDFMPEFQRRYGRPKSGEELSQKIIDAFKRVEAPTVDEKEGGDDG